MFVLLIDTAQDYGSVPEVHGPFEDVNQAQEYAAAYRVQNDIPGAADDELPTEEEHDLWSEAGYTFRIVSPMWEVACIEPT